jgi:hypothetical protein
MLRPVCLDERRHPIRELGDPSDSVQFLLKSHPNRELNLNQREAIHWQQHLLALLGLLLQPL